MIDEKMLAVERFDNIKKSQADDYLMMYKRNRDYYMAERNFMLTASALFVYFVFQRFLYGFKKLTDIEE